MGGVSVAEMIEAEKAAFASGWSEEAVLELAGSRLGHAIGRFFRHPGLAVGYLGKGHNAGDTLVALGVLRDEYGWRVGLRTSNAIESCALLVGTMAARCGPFIEWDPADATAPGTRPLLLLDGLLGSGARGAIRPPVAELAGEMNRLRATTGARIAAVDLPSGVDPDTGECFPGAVEADVTFTIGNVKQGLLRCRTAANVGALVRVEVPPLTRDGSDPWNLVTPSLFGIGRSPRPFEFHKGQAGRVGIIAGSRRYAGAAALAATGALKAGAGLVTIHTQEDAVAAVALRCPPEIIVRGFVSPLEALETPCDSRVIGCGIGFPLDGGYAADLVECMRDRDVPAVLDADALNLLADRGDLTLLHERHILTPHPGEFRRLAPDLADLPREDSVTGFIRRSPATLLLKGARTLIGRQGGPLWCIGTGNPGMATGGQGDLLSGAIGAICAGGDQPDACAAFAAWLCGRAAEIALWESDASEESLTPSEVASHLGRAFRDWREGTR